MWRTTTRQGFARAVGGGEPTNQSRGPTNNCRCSFFFAQGPVERRFKCLPDIYIYIHMHVYPFAFGLPATVPCPFSLRPVCMCVCVSVCVMRVCAYVRVCVCLGARGSLLDTFWMGFQCLLDIFWLTLWTPGRPLGPFRAQDDKTNRNSFDLVARRGLLWRPL